jgi:hypothetical protein
MMHLTSVDLPAPFSPRSACTLPGVTSIETFSRAVNDPKRLVRPAPVRPKASMVGCKAVAALMTVSLDPRVAR